MLWKYKEDFTYGELGSEEENSELVLVEKIVENNPFIAKTGNLVSFIDTLEMRGKREEDSGESKEKQT